jgi:hypothetical protein
VSWDFSKGEQVKYPCLCNGPPDPNPVGDCYYEAAEHGSNQFTAWTGTEYRFDAAATKSRYLQISGGDNGLSDQDMIPEWTKGIVGPNGPRNILDSIIVPFGDRAHWAQMFWASGGLIWTCSLLGTWLTQDSPGALWDSGSRPDPNAGHAMWLSGRRPDSTTDTRTWGITPPIHVTDSGFAAADSEFIAVFAADQFDPKTGLCVYTGMPWEDKRQWWMAVGGKDVGPSPFGPTPQPPLPPSPPVPPLPPAPQPYRVDVPQQPVYVLGMHVGYVPAFSVQATPVSHRAGANWQQLLTDLSATLTDFQAGNWLKLLTVDVPAIVRDLGFAQQALGFGPVVPWPVVVGDVFALVAAVLAKNIPGIITAALKLLADFGVNLGPQQLAAMKAALQ